MDVARVEGRTDLIERSPLPSEFDIRGIALLADPGDGQQLSSRSGDGEGRLFRVRGGDEHSKRVDAGWREQDVPTGRGRESRRTRGAGTGDPSVLLEYERFGCEVILVGDHTRLQPKLLPILERVGGVDQVGSETTG